MLKVYSVRIYYDYLRKSLMVKLNPFSFIPGRQETWVREVGWMMVVEKPSGKFWERCLRGCFYPYLKGC